LSRPVPPIRAGSDPAASGTAESISAPARAPRLISELERLLREPGCPVCRTLEEGERSFFSWFQIESFSAAEVQARLRAGMGMCPRHSRRLVDDLGEGEGHIMNTVMRHALAGARQGFGAAGSPVPARPARQSPSARSEDAACCSAGWRIPVMRACTAITTASVSGTLYTPPSLPTAQRSCCWLSGPPRASSSEMAQPS
jgi:hypothetical protein